MAQDGDLAPNVKLEPDEVYLDLAHRMVTIMKDLVLLYSAAVRPSSNALPSWVPDWRVSPICHGLSTAIDKTSDRLIY